MSQNIPISSSPQHSRFVPPPSSRSRSSSNANSVSIISSSPSQLSSSPSFISSTIMMDHQKNKHTPLSKEEEELMNQKKERFQTCKEVIDRLMWDESLADVMPNLSMIYKDRFEGDVLISYSEYENGELKEDLPQHRIQSLIYRDEHVFWDKNNRIDLITSKEIFPLIDSYLNPAEVSDSTTQGSAEIKKKKKKNSKPSISLEKSKASTLTKTISGNDLDEEEEDEIDQYIAEYDEEYGMYLK